MSLIFSESEWEWIDRRAERIALETGHPLPFARAAAISEMKKLRRMPKAEVIELESRRIGFRRNGTA